MIIRKDTTSKTATRSPLNSRSVRRTCGQREAMESTLKARDSDQPPLRPRRGDV